MTDAKLTDVQRELVIRHLTDCPRRVAYVQRVEPATGGDHGRSLVRQAKQLGLTEEDIEALLIDGVIEAAVTWQSTAGTFLYWAGQMMCSVLNNEVRRLSTQARLPKGLTVSADDPSARGITSREDHQESDRLRVDELLHLLTPKAARIMRLYYGLDGPPVTVVDLAGRYGMTAGQVNKLIERSIGRMAKGVDGE